MNAPSPVYGLLAEFLTPEEVIEAAKRTREAGYHNFDAFTPYPIEGLGEILGVRSSRVPSIVLFAGIVGAGVGFFMQFWSMAVDYPLNVGGRPYNSWPVFIPITFEVMVLVASFAAILSMLFLNGLPRPHHPLFNEPRFVRASQDRFFLCIETVDPKFDRWQTHAFLESLGPHGEIMEIPREAPGEDALEPEEEPREETVEV
jgi:hypothetical protein